MATLVDSKGICQEVYIYIYIKYLVAKAISKALSSCGGVSYNTLAYILYIVYTYQIVHVLWALEKKDCSSSSAIFESQTI